MEPPQPLFDIAFCEVKNLALLALTRLANRGGVLDRTGRRLPTGDTADCQSAPRRTLTL
jgi:hypothetical protein